MTLDHRARASAGGTEQLGLIADFIERRSPRAVLVAENGGGALAAELAGRGIEAAVVDVDPAVMQLRRRFDAIVVGHELLGPADDGRLRAIVHSLAQHLLPGGAVVSRLGLLDRASAALVARYDVLCADCELSLSERWSGWDRRRFEAGSADEVISVHCRTSRYNVHDMLFDARATIDRLMPEEVWRRLTGPHPPLVIDTRSHEDVVRLGSIAGAIEVPRTVVEWHVDPANGYRHPAAPSFDRPIVVVCNDGYSSSLTAANLVRIGFLDVADMIGGVQAWRAAGLPTQEHGE